MRTILLSLSIAALLAVTACAPTRPAPDHPAAPRPAAKTGTPPVRLPGAKPDGSVLLPNQWSLRPVGKQVELGDFPINVAVHPGGRFAAVLHSGYSEHEIRVVDIASATVVSRTDVHEAFYGLEFSKDGRQLFCSGAGDEVVHSFEFQQGSLTNHYRIKLRDPKLRAIELPSRRKILLSDTVGFIRNLPHTLVTSFRATLEEVAQAEVLLHVRDAASTYGDEQKAQVEKVLGELDSLSKPRIEVMNKIDLLDPHERLGLEDRARSGGEVAVSAVTGEGLDSLLASIDAALHSDPILSAELRVPQQEGAVLAAIDAGMVVHSRAYEGNLVRLSVTGPASLLGRLRKYRLRDE